MPYLIGSPPEHFYCWVRDHFLYEDRPKHFGNFTKAIVVGLRSAGAEALGFWCLLENGAQYGPLPIHALAHREGAPQRELHDLELWDCFGEDFGVARLDFLTHMRCYVRVGDPWERDWESARYLFTIDWTNNGCSNEPSQRKTAHLVALADGNYALQPNNRMLWDDASFTELNLGPHWHPGYSVQTRLWRAEDGPRRHLTEDWDYEVVEDDPCAFPEDKHGEHDHDACLDAVALAKQRTANERAALCGARDKWTPNLCTRPQGHDGPHADSKLTWFEAAKEAQP